MNRSIIPIYIGYDPREAVAYHVCANSIIRHASRPVALIPLALNLFQGVYQEQHGDHSNHFVYTRFLVPWLMNWQGRAIFIDGDMIVRSDIAELWDITESQDYDVHVVKHDYRTRATKKYMGAVNHDYPCKNWSSVVVWNCASAANSVLTPEFVSQQPGSYLHRFAWLPDPRINSLPIEWNWLPDEFGARPDAKILHYTLGTPCFVDYADTPQAEDWHRERIFTTHCEQVGIS